MSYTARADIIASRIMRCKRSPSLSTSYTQIAEHLRSTPDLYDIDNRHIQTNVLEADVGFVHSKHIRAAKKVQLTFDGPSVF
jgi:hypothetical protein